LAGRHSDEQLGCMPAGARAHKAASRRGSHGGFEDVGAEEWFGVGAVGKVMLACLIASRDTESLRVDKYFIGEEEDYNIGH